jgi:hypothetical protein
VLTEEGMKLLENFLLGPSGDREDASPQAPAVRTG